MTYSILLIGLNFITCRRETIFMCSKVTQEIKVLTWALPTLCFNSVDSSVLIVKPYPQKLLLYAPIIFLCMSKL